MTSVTNITPAQVYNRLIAQLPPWFGNQIFVSAPISSVKTPTTNFNNILWMFLTTAFNSYLQMQYDFLQLRIGQYEINNDPNWPINIPSTFPFNPNPSLMYSLLQPQAVSVVGGGGSNYQIGDTITLAGGVFNTPTILQVTNVFIGIVVNVNIIQAGNYATAPTNPVKQATTSGSGKGAQFNVTYQPNFPQYPIAFSDNLDLIAQDFFGTYLTRRPYETDDNFRNRILANVMKPKATRPAMLAALIALVTPAFEQAGIPVVIPEIYEPWNTIDDGGYNDYQALAFGTQGGFNGVGFYASPSVPYTCYITVYLPSGSGMANYPGWSTPGETVTWGAGFGDPSITPVTTPSDIPPQWYGTYDLLNYYVTEADVLNLINLMKVLGTVCYLTIVYVN